MFSLVFLQVVNYLFQCLSNNLTPFSLYEIRDFGRLTFNPPPPSPKLFFPSSADYADEYYLRSLANITVTIPPPLLFDYATTFENPADTDSSFLRVCSLPGLSERILQGVAQIASWMGERAVEIIIVTLQVIYGLGTWATNAWAFHEQRRQELEMRIISSLLPFWELASIVDHQGTSIDLLRDQLRGSKEKLESQKALTEELTRQGEDQRRDHDALVQAMEDLRVQKDASGDLNHRLELTIERKNKVIEMHEEDLRVQQEDSATRLASLEVQIADHQASLQSTIADADERVQKTQQTADERVRELEARLDAQQESGDKTAKLEGDLATAREHIERLMSTIRSNSMELQMYRDRVRAQRQQVHPPPFQPAPTQPFPPPHSPQSPFAPRPTQIPGFPPNRTAGFMGNNPPPGWARGGGGAGGGGSR